MDAFLLITFLLIIYFIPVIVASTREHHNAGAIFLLNLFLGWTLLGWVAALVWAATSASPPAPHASSIPTLINQANEKPCPYCAEMIKAAATKCRFCNSPLPDLGAYRR